MKSGVAPNTYLYQIVVKDHAHRQPPPKSLYGYKSYITDKSLKDISDFIPLRTFFRWAKGNRQAQDKVKKHGEVISCRKVDSQYRRLEMIEHLHLDIKPITVDISLEDFTIGRDLEITPIIKETNIDIKQA